MSILGWIILGLIAGWLAGVLVKGSGYGVVGDIVLGILGALVGGAITSTLMGVDITGFNLESVLVAVLGAIVVIFIARLISGSAGGRATGDPGFTSALLGRSAVALPGFRSEPRRPPLLSDGD